MHLFKHRFIKYSPYRMTNVFHLHRMSLLDRFHHLSKPVSQQANNTKCIKKSKTIQASLKCFTWHRKPKEAKFTKSTQS